jgi:hypothetical protein
MRKAILLALACCASLYAGVFLLGDAATASLRPYDPQSGRQRGCYSATELALGLTEPSEAVRTAQALAGLALIGLPPAFLGRMMWRRRRSSGLPLVGARQGDHQTRLK